MTKIISLLKSPIYSNSIARRKPTTDTKFISVIKQTSPPPEIIFSLIKRKGKLKEILLGGDASLPKSKF